MENETLETQKKQTKKLGCALYIVAFVVALYVVQWLLQSVFQRMGAHESSAALQPYQNHYLSFVSPYITTESSASEFTSDLTSVGRFAGFILISFFVWLVVIVPLYFIKPLRNQYGKIAGIFGLLLMFITYYSAAFVPPRKTYFEGSTMVVEQNKWIVGKTSARINYQDIERFESDFLVEHTHEDGTLMYSQLFAVIGGKRYFIGENEISPADDKYKPTPAQLLEAQNAVDALTKIIGRTVH